MKGARTRPSTKVSQWFGNGWTAPVYETPFEYLVVAGDSGDAS